MNQPELLFAIATAPSESAIASVMLDRIPGILGADWVGYYILDAQPTVGVHVRGMPDADVEIYEREGRKVDALHAYVVKHHIAVRTDYADLARFPEFFRFVKRTGFDTRIRQCMHVPIVHGSVVGMMHFATLKDGTFPTRALLTGMALSTHVSARVAVLRALDGLNARWEHVLSAREREVGHLAARGLSTAHMARVAGVSENTIKKHLKNLYAKLYVSSRAELGAALVRGPEAANPTDRPGAGRKPGRRA